MVLGPIPYGLISRFGADLRDIASRSALGH